MTKIEGAKKVPGAKIAAWTADGQEFILNHRFAHRDDAKLFDCLARIREQGSINLQHWRKANRGEI